MSMQNGPTFPSEFQLSRMAELIEVLKDGQAKPEKSFAVVVAGLWVGRWHRSEYVMEGADQKLVLIAKVHIKRRSADIGAVQDLLDRDGVIIPLVNQRMQRVA